jgi:hypothetical protein
MAMRVVMSTLAIWALLQAAAAGQATSNGPWRSVTLKGCVQATGDPSIFLLAVPATVPDPVRGIAEGKPVPEGAGAGPKPRPNPRTAPPTDLPRAESTLPEGRYATPTMRHLVYRLMNADATTLEQQIGDLVEVHGEIEIEGYPSGDAPRTASTTGERRVNQLLRVRSIKKLGDVCPPGPPESR